MTGAGAAGIAATGDGSLEQNFDIEDNTVSGQPGAAFSVAADTASAGLASGFVSNNVIGTGTAGSGSSGGDGINISVASGGTLIISADANLIGEIPLGTGVHADSTGGSTLQLTLEHNQVTMAGAGSSNGITVSESGAAGGTVCVKPAQNTVRSTGAGAYDIALEQLTATGTFGIDGYDSSLTVPAFVSSTNTLNGGGAFATAAGNAAGFSASSCTVPEIENG